jgi:hypothetical protein
LEIETDADIDSVDANYGVDQDYDDDIEGSESAATKRILSGAGLEIDFSTTQSAPPGTPPESREELVY